LGRGDLRVEPIGLEVTLGVGQVGLVQDRAAAGEPHRPRIVEARPTGADVVVDAAVRLHQQDDVLDVVEAAAALAIAVRWRGGDGLADVGW
jgi:hypothetical protein